MKLWHIRSDLKKYSYRGSWAMGIYQLWLGTHIYQLVTKRGAR